MGFALTSSAVLPARQGAPVARTGTRRIGGRPGGRRGRLSCNAGWFDNFGKSTDSSKDEEFLRQQEILERRRSGKALDSANKRRGDLKKELEDPVKRAAAYKKVVDSKFIPGGEYIEEGWVEEESDKDKKGGFFGKLFGKKGKE